MITDTCPSHLYPDRWFWCVREDNGLVIAAGYAADEWLAKANARVATKRHQEEQDTNS